MSKLWFPFLKAFNKIGEVSGCHQIPKRCFKMKGYIFPLCARCTGVAVGQILCVILLIFNIKINLITAILFLLIMGFDWFIQHIEILESNNTRRFTTGILGGFAVITIYYYIAIKLFELLKIF
jgi:uncharacterized membrane protein